jgi:ribonuclease HII
MKYPNFSFEKRLWKKGFKFIAGVDEVGRGSFAGPVVVGCVVFNKGIKVPKDVVINDSKKLTEKRRIASDEWIRKNALTYAVGEVSASVINRVGMADATKTAFRRAVANTNNRSGSSIDYLLIDAFYIPHTRGFPIRRKKARKNHKLSDSRARQLAIVNGDEKSLSIAAASIIAKIYRDKLMKRLAKRPSYRKYVWDRNKGYATKEHISAIKRYGITSYHRKAFIETYYRNRRS